MAEAELVDSWPKNESGHSMMQVVGAKVDMTDLMTDMESMMDEAAAAGGEEEVEEAEEAMRQMFAV